MFYSAKPRKTRLLLPKKAQEPRQLLGLYFLTYRASQFLFPRASRIQSARRCFRPRGNVGRLATNRSASHAAVLLKGFAKKARPGDQTGTGFGLLAETTRYYLDRRYFGSCSRMAWRAAAFRRAIIAYMMLCGVSPVAFARLALMLARASILLYRTRYDLGFSATVRHCGFSYSSIPMPAA